MTRLPDLIIEGGRAKLVERELIEYPPPEETKAEREAREKRGDPPPSGPAFVVSRRVGIGEE